MQKGDNSGKYEIALLLFNFAWIQRFKSLSLPTLLLNFKLGLDKWVRSGQAQSLRQMFKISHADLNEWLDQWFLDCSFVDLQQHLKGFAFCQIALFQAKSQKLWSLDDHISTEELWPPHWCLETPIAPGFRPPALAGGFQVWLHFWNYCSTFADSTPVLHHLFH